MEEQDLVSEFVVESKEGLESIEDDFLELEKSVEQVDPELINKIFRAIHSIKGASGFFGLMNIGHLSHIMENLISKIREGEYKPESKYVDALLEGVDLLNVMLDDVEHQDKVEVETLCKKMEAFLNLTSQEDESSEPQGDAEEPAEVVMDDLQLQVLAELEAELKQESEPQKENKSLKEEEVEKDKNEEATSSAVKVEKPTPIETIRINVDLLDKLMRLAGELVLVRNQHLLNVNREDSLARSISQKLDMVTTDLQESIMQTRMQPIGNVFGKFPRVIRDMGKKLGKKLAIETSGNDVDLDKSILEAIADPLTHLIRNSCDHGVEMPEDRKEAGKPDESIIKLDAYHAEGQINIKIVDDGKGINIEAVKKKVLEKGLKTHTELEAMSHKELSNLITLPGLSTAEKITDVSGRGVGMDVVRSSIEKLGGTMDIETTAGQGTTITLKLPLTLAIISCLFVQANEERFALPQTSLVELVCLYDDDTVNKFEVADKQIVYRLRDQILPVIHLNDILSSDTPIGDVERETYIERLMEKKGKAQDKCSLFFAVLKIEDVQFGLIIDEVIGTEEIVVKPMHKAMNYLTCYSGSTVMGDGKVALILDIAGLAQYANISFHQNRLDEYGIDEGENTKRSVLLFKSEKGEQFAVELSRIKRIQPIQLSKFEMIGGASYADIDGVPIRAVQLSEFVSVSSCRESEDMFLILPKNEASCGLLISQPDNIIEFDGNLSSDSFIAPSIEGSAIVNGKTTLFIDLYQLGDLALKERA